MERVKKTIYGKIWSFYLKDTFIFLKEKMNTV